MATVNLGRIKFVWQGAYNGATAYVADDVVSYNGSSYICILASTGNLPTNATYWSLMAQSGTDITSLAGLAQGDVLYYNGTAWVRLGAGTSGQYLKTNGASANPSWANGSASTLTTQGDILYRDASGLQRLGAGTSGQVLTTQGSGANPQWSTVSSDFVKLATGTASGSSFVTFNGHFSSTYDTYQLIGYDVQMSVDNGRLSIQLAYGGSYTYNTGSNYGNFTQGGYTDLSSTMNGSWSDGAFNDGWHIRFDQGNSSSQTAIYDFKFYNFNSTSTTYKTFLGISHRSNSSWAVSNHITSGYVSDSTLTSNAITGLRVSNYNGTITKGKFVLYGLKGI